MISVFLLFGLSSLPDPCAAVSLEVLGRLPDIEDVCLSPDGTRLAMVRTLKGIRVLTIESLQDHAAMGGMRLGDTKLRGIKWADDRHVLVFTSEASVPWGFRRTFEWEQLQVYDVASKQSTVVPREWRSSFHPLVSDVPIMNVVAGPVMIRHVDGQTLLFVHGYYLSAGSVLPMLLRFNVDTGQQKLVREGRGDTSEWLVDASGEVVADENYEESARRWSIRIRKDGQLTEVAAGKEAIDLPKLLGFGPAGDSILVKLFVDGDPVWKMLSLQDGSFGAPIAEGRTMDWPIEDPETQRLIGGAQVDDTASYTFFEPRRQSQWSAIVRAFGGDKVRFVSAAKDFSKVVVRVDGSGFGYGYQLVDLTSHRAEPIGDAYSGLTRPLEVRRITYAASDNLMIPAYVTLPHREDAGRLPLVVLPHGGPASRDTADFDWISQALAGEGYAVLRPNYRGSTLNWKFEEAGFGEVGRRMQSDLSDGVAYLVESGMVDPARVCIVGASYGGYAALAGVTLDARTYRCAVSISGISDLARMLNWIQARQPGESSVSQRFWDRFLGVSGPDDPLLKALSPIGHLSDVKAPVLLIHGKDDTVVPIVQSEAMYDALKSAGKEVEFVPLAGEDHWLSRSETRLQMLRATVRFLRSHNPPQ